MFYEIDRKNNIKKSLLGTTTYFLFNLSQHALLCVRYLAITLLIINCEPQLNKNNLKDERNLFLKKSQSDDIHWQKWNKKTLNAAKKENKLIYLTIGYATCFACEKMQDESYSNTNIATLLNKNYISIKVDREAQPDVDIHFLNLQTSIMKFGAWPINLILTADLKPVYAMTYMTQPQLSELLNRIQIAWNKEPDKILQQIDQFLSSIKPDEDKKIDFKIDESLINDFYSRYTHQFDTLYGGIKTGADFSPKFPNNDDLRLLLRYHFKKQDPQPLAMVNKTIMTLAKSALFDHIEGGIHRYSITRDWNTPNFEKVLMDQGSFLNILTELHLVEPNPFYEKTIEQTVNYLINNLLDKKGGFYSSQSASTKGQEGLYYTWQEHEIQASLKPADFKDFLQTFTLNSPQSQFLQRRSLSLKTTTDFEKTKFLRSQLLKSKYKSVKPEIDKKIMTAQTSYTLSSLIKLAKVWPSTHFEELIKKGLDFLLTQHQSVNDTFYRYSIGGAVSYPAILDDYAFLIDALIEYYQFSFNEKYLMMAKKIQDQQDKVFLKQNGKAYIFNPHSQKIFGPQYLIKDKPYPSGQSMTYWNLIRLSRYFPRSHYSQQAKNLLHTYPDQLKQDPASYTHLLLAVDFENNQPQDLIISGKKEECQEQAKKVYKKYFPYLQVSCANAQTQLSQNQDKLRESLKFNVCRKDSCLPEFKSVENALRAIYTFQL